MHQQEIIGKAFQRTQRVLTRRPAVGQGTAVTRVRLADGFRCEIADGPWRLVADMSDKAGGEGSAPDPGVLGRGALGSCIAISYAMWAAQAGVLISSVEVEIQADYDARGHYRFADVTPGYNQVRYLVTVESGAPDEDVIRVLDEADAHTSWLDVFRRAHDVRRDVHIVAPRS